MDLNKPPVPNFNTRVEMQYVYRPKAQHQELIVRNFGEEYYREVIESPIPFIVPMVIERFKVLILTLY